MDQDKQLEKQFQAYEVQARENKNIDVATLMINAMENQNKKLVSPRLRKWAYVISIGFPPFGVLFVPRFYFGQEDDARHTGNVCLVLTAIALVFLILSTWVTGKIFFSSAGININQLQNINIKELQDLMQ